MKIVFIILLFVSCNTVGNPEGMYTCTYEHEFAQTEDTLLLKRINKNYYQIERHSGVTRKEDGKRSAKKMVVENWKLEYDNNKQLLTEIKTGKKLFWIADKRVLILGNREYVSNK